MGSLTGTPAAPLTPRPLSQQPASPRMVTLLRPCRRPRSPKGTFPATPAASRDQRPWMAAGKRPSWVVPRSSWGLSPWHNPPEPTSSAASHSGSDSGVGLEGTAAGRGQGSPSGGTSGPARLLQHSQMLGGHEVPQDVLHCAAWHHCPEGLRTCQGTALPAETPQPLTASPRFASRLRRGARDGSRVCRQLKPAQDTVTSQHGHTETFPHLPWGTARCK